MSAGRHDWRQTTQAKATRAPLALAILLVLGPLSGCVTGLDDGAGGNEPGKNTAIDEVQFEGRVRALNECASGTYGCFEPSLAVDPTGRMFVTGAFGSPIAVSADGGKTFESVDAPRPLGAAAFGQSGDGFVQTGPDGALWFTRLHSPAVRADDPTSVGGVTGVHVAKSTDGGRTWSPNHVVDMGVTTDRQWLAFDGLGNAYISFNGLDHGIHVSRSSDGGETFDPPVAVAPSDRIGGQLVASPSGRLVLPHFHYESEAIAVSLSDDHGKTWRLVIVATDPQGIGDFFPRVVKTDDGLVLVWKNSAHRLLLSRSGDGGMSWSAPEQISSSDERVVNSPWADVDTAGRLHIAYFVQPDEEAASVLMVKRATVDGWMDGTTGAPVESSIKKDRPGNTDFAHFALTPDGKMIAPLSFGKEGIFILSEKAGTKES